jgi:NADH-quinone oxidoreductase subunit G
MCGVGCAIVAQTRNGELMRVNGRLNEDVNEEWTCDRGKFEQYWVNSPDRAKNPLVRRGDELMITGWDDVYAIAAEKLKALDAKSIAGIGSPRASNEDLYLFQRMMRGVLGTNHLDHRMFPFPIQPMQSSIADIGQAKHIVAVGTEIDDDLPVLWLRVYKAISKNGAKYFRDDDVRSKAVDEAIAGGSDTVVLAWYGLPEADIAFLNSACAASGAKMNLLLPHANSWGAITMGVLPDRLPAMQSVSNGARPKYEALWGGPIPAEPGLDTKGILEGCVNGTIQALYVMGNDLLKDFPDPELARRALDAVPFLIVQDQFVTETAQCADVFFPSCSFIEKDGSFTNIEGRVQSKADWQIVAEMMTRLGKPAPYFSPRDIAREIARVTAP